MRLFVALSLPSVPRRELTAAVESLKRSHPRLGRFSRPENLHLTLAFIGEMKESKVPVILEALSKVPPEEMRFGFTRPGTFRSGILWAGLEEKETLERMAQSVRNALDSVHIPYDRKAFRAHVTLARDWRGPQAEELEAAGLKLPRGLRNPVSAVPELFESYRDDRGAVRYRSLSRGE
ncbi:RNA 2',3'-cyclic phosphodiesterase [Sutterella sp.]|uniref:RNA 2',3'-cyclic phosphodiesterase n=1 Tax=Sutterella sp. TaxID=1981025 RepID=UPI0026E09F0A|nr:RNA 2',3'-cyclic phosphodiesterase [Sutterella sp.]MDO5532703.1 RNA 2',3'-cyclic phosphodiesterase [Sutterella sp.]